MIKNLFLSTLFISVVGAANAQNVEPGSFKCGWNTYKAVTVIHEYTFSYVLKDSVKLYLADSAKTYIAKDSECVMSTSFPFRDANTFKSASYYKQRKLVKSEEYRDKDLLNSKEFKYDDKGRRSGLIEFNSVTGARSKKSFDYSSDKSTGEAVVTEVSYVNDQVEFYTKSYYNKENQKIKEVRLNNNNKDIVHTETFSYNEAGKLKERKVHFHEFNVTKTFPESVGENPAKCFRMTGMNMPEKPTPATKVAFLKKLIMKNKVLLSDPDCKEFEYKFNSPDCEVIASSIKGSSNKQVVFRWKERILK